MATALALDFDGPSEIAIAVASNPAIVLIDAGKRDDLYAHIQREIDAFQPDLSTTKGRDAIKSLAHKITRTKTAIDAAGKALNEEARAQINVVDAARRDSKAKLDAMAEAVRKPLTDWEEAEKARVAACEADIAAMTAAGNVSLDDTSDTVRERGQDLWNQSIDEARYGSLYGQAVAVKAASVDRLKAALDRLTREEADRAELAKLRAEQEARAEADRAAAEEAERQRTEAARIEQERIATERAEAARVAAEEAQAERVRLAAEQATKDAERDAERKAQEERDRIKRGREMLIYIREVVSGRIGGDPYPFGVLLRELESKVVVDESYGDMRDEIERARLDGIIALNEAMERQAERRRREDEAEDERRRLEAERARQENKAHISRVMRTAKEAIMTCGANEEVAKAIVVAIKANTIPAITIRF